MHIQKLLICVAAVTVAGSLNLLAADNDLQAKAREALREKMAQLDGNGGTASGVTSAPAAPTAPAAPAVVAPAPAPAPAVNTPAPEAPVSAPVAQDSHRLTPEEMEKAIAAERAAVARSESEEQAKSQAAANAKQEAAARKKAQQAAIAEKRKADAEALAAQKKAAADELAQRQMEKSAQTPKPAPTSAPEIKQASAKPAVTAPVVTATAPASGSKEQRLNDLLQLYKADKITPTEYHQERAKILAMP